MAPKSIQHQQGFLIPLAIFIVVAMGVLALTISRFSSATFSSAVQEVLSVQTLYAADSAAQYGVHSVTFDVANRAVADTRCTALNGTALNFSGASLNSCSAQLTCERVTNVGGGVRVYRIESTAECGAGNLTSLRRVEVGAQL